MAFNELFLRLHGFERLEHALHLFPDNGLFSAKMIPVLFSEPRGREFLFEFADARFACRVLAHQGLDPFFNLAEFSFKLLHAGSRQLR